MNRPSNRNRWGFQIALSFAYGMAVTVLPTGAQAADFAPRGSAVTTEATQVGAQVLRVGSYDPSRVYVGFHESQRVYKLVQGPQTWKLHQRPAIVRDVTCREARQALEQEGLWTGRLANDGSCRTGDETQWASGNYLNFQAGPDASEDL